MRMKPVYANLGCGSRYHPDWLNFDLNATAPGVRSCNLLGGVPLPDNHCDAVFNSALLEHLPPETTSSFLAECRRILKPGGVLRIGVPNLESIAQRYLEKLERCLAGDTTAAADYDWMMLEMVDQLVRNRPGGRMAAFIATGAPNEGFVRERIGIELDGLQAGFRAVEAGTWHRLRQMPPAIRRHKIRQRLFRIPTDIRRFLAGLLLSRQDRAALQLGAYRLSGEVHLWMYDRFSLPRLLRQSGFQNPVLKPAGESEIDGWKAFGLDTDSNHKPLKPDLFFVECRK